MLSQLANATTDLTTLLRWCWQGRHSSFAQQERLAVALVNSVHAVLARLLLGQMQQKGGIEQHLNSGSSEEEPPFPIPAREFRCAQRTLTAELEYLERGFAMLVQQQADGRMRLREFERRERLLRQGAERDEAEIARLGSTLTRSGGKSMPMGVDGSVSHSRHPSTPHSPQWPDAPAVEDSWLSTAAAPSSNRLALVAASSPPSHEPLPDHPIQPHEAARREVCRSSCQYHRVPRPIWSGGRTTARSTPRAAVAVVVLTSR